MKRGSPGVGKPHAGKYGELTPSRQRGGGGWMKPPASALPTQTLACTPVLKPKSGDFGYTVLRQQLIGRT